MTFDRFHVIKLMNERLDDLRREMEGIGVRGPSQRANRFNVSLLFSAENRLNSF